MGNRFKGGIQPGAMPWHHRYIGNPVLSFIGRLFFKTPANDFHCGLRGFTKEAVEKMDLQYLPNILGMKTHRPEGFLEKPVEPFKPLGHCPYFLR
jgi:hypothetical protein